MKINGIVISTKRNNWICYRTKILISLEERIAAQGGIIPIPLMHALEITSLKRNVKCDWNKNRVKQVYLLSYRQRNIGFKCHRGHMLTTPQLVGLELSLHQTAGLNLTELTTARPNIAIRLKNIIPTPWNLYWSERNLVVSRVGIHVIGADSIQTRNFE